MKLLTCRFPKYICNGTTDPNHPALRLLSYGLVAVVFLSVGALAAPLLPHEKDLPDPIRSLANIERVQIQKIDHTPGKLQEHGISARYIEDRIRRRFEEEGIRIHQDDPSLPLIGLRYLVQTEPRVEEAVAFAILLQLHQSVYINRLDMEMKVPTYNGFILGLEHEEDFEDSIRRGIETMIDGLLLRIQAGTKLKKLTD